jgi:5-methyltetrahydrofolate--homocysteine methyltransferase
MIIIGESINSTTSEVLNAIENRNTEFIQNLTNAQVDAGAHYIDVNAGARINTEAEDIQWLVRSVWDAAKVKMSIDSANPAAIQKGLETYHELVEKDEQPDKFKVIVNSINGEPTHCEKILPLVKKYDCEVIGLLMDENGIPSTAEERVNVAGKIIDLINKYDIPLANLYLDLVVQPISTDATKGLTILDTLKLLKIEFQDIKTVLGLSNISFGLPEMELVNQTFMAMLMAEGLDAAILNPLDKRLMATLSASKMLLNQDEFCMGYINAFRSGLLKF